jgi:hypothetical protein
MVKNHKSHKLFYARIVFFKFEVGNTLIIYEIRDTKFEVKSED